MQFTIKNQEICNYNENNEYVFPKYTSQLINWANQNAQGTRPNIVGQMSDLFPEFASEVEEKSVKSWRQWYLNRFPNALDTAAAKIYTQVQNLRNAMQLIDEKMVHHWVEDLVIAKTYNGLYVQKAILMHLAKMKKMPYRLANSSEEAKGIDGYVGETPYSVKPETYKTMKRLSESIEVKMIYYFKTKTGLKIEVEE